MAVIKNYEEQVYAGVLGKVIGVYMGRPFEGWSKETLEQRWGRIDRYVHEDTDKPLIVIDDDITGTFTFIRALEDSGLYADTPPEFFGKMWLDYLIERKTVLWWGGMGHSTEHTAYLRLKHGVESPRSGSIELNGRTVAEQIGAQIFIDAYGMVAPGDPRLAAKLAGRAAGVSHDGEAVHAATVVAGMVAAAFVEKKMDRLLDIGVALIPPSSLIARVHADVRAWVRKDGDWRKTYERINKKYGYQKYGGNCHVIPNHAIMVMAWAYAPDDFHEAQAIVNTAGWDTDCNAANVGSVMGIKVGLDRICEKYDFRGPIADRMLLPTADGTRSVSDCLTEALHIARIGRRVMGWPGQKIYKKNAWHHFSLPGALHGWICDDRQFATRGNVALENVIAGKDRAMCATFKSGPGAPARLLTTIMPTTDPKHGYTYVGTPRLSSGQTVTIAGRMDALSGKAAVSVFVETVHADGAEPTRLYGQSKPFTGKTGAFTLRYRIPDTQGLTVGALGIEVTSPARAQGRLLIDAVRRSGSPDIRWEHAPQPGAGWILDGDMQRGAFSDDKEPVQHVGKSEGRGVFVTGNTDWNDYTFSARFKVHMAEKAGMMVRYRGLLRHIALEKTRDSLRLVLRHYGEAILDEKKCRWRADSLHALRLVCKGRAITAYCDGKKVLEGIDDTLGSGGAGFFFENGIVGFREVKIEGEQHDRGTLNPTRG